MNNSQGYQQFAIILTFRLIPLAVKTFHKIISNFPPSSYFPELLSLNTTAGPFRKLGRLYESCLRQQLNSSTIRLTIEKLGGYLPINALGPSSVTPLMVNMQELGAPMPLLDVYYDLSYGRRPQVLLIIDIPPDVSHLLQVSWDTKTKRTHSGNKNLFLQNPGRWLTPKAPPFKIDENVPTLLDDILKYFLPMGLSIEQRESERQSINRFIRELNQIRKNNVDRDFASSYVVSNVSALAESFPFVSVSHHRHAM